MHPINRPTRVPVAIAAWSLVAILPAHALAPGDTGARAVVSDLAGTGTAVYAVAGGAVLVAVAVLLLGLRLIYSSRADRRYAVVLESEVASQTRSLMDSLAATAAAERNLRMVMDAMPDAIVVVDRDGRILESNEPARALGASSDAPDGRSLF